MSAALVEGQPAASASEPILRCGAFMAPEDRLLCVAEVEDAARACGAQVELAFAAGFDARTRQLFAPRLLARGHGSAVLARPASLVRGEMHLHCHPDGRLVPSDEDLALAETVAALGAGAAVCNSRFEKFFTIVEPAPPSAPHPFAPRLLRFGRRRYVFQRLS